MQPPAVHNTPSLVPETDNLTFEPDLSSERSRPGFAAIANGLVKTIFESAYELSRGGRLQYYLSAPWRAVANNDSGQLLMAIKAIATLVRICPTSCSIEETEYKIQGMLVQYHGRLAGEIKAAGGSSQGKWRWTAEHFIEASHWDLAEEEFYTRYQYLRPNYHDLEIGQQISESESCGLAVQAENIRPDFDADDGLSIRWGWNGAMFKEQLLTAWDDSRVGYSPPEYVRNPRRQLVLDVVGNRGGWLVHAARRIYAAAFLQTGHRGRAQQQVSDAYLALTDWLWQVHGRHQLCLSAQEWIDAAVTQSDADFYRMHNHLWWPKHGASNDLPLRNRKVVSAYWSCAPDTEITETDLEPVKVAPARTSPNYINYYNETSRQHLQGKWPCWAIQQPYGVGEPPASAEFEDPNGMTIMERIQLSAPRNWPELYTALRRIPNYSPTPNGSGNTSSSTRSYCPTPETPSSDEMDYN